MSDNKWSVPDDDDPNFNDFYESRWGKGGSYGDIKSAKEDYTDEEMDEGF